MVAAIGTDLLKRNLKDNNKDVYGRLNYYGTYLLKSINEEEMQHDTFYYYLLHEGWVWKYETKSRIVKELTKFALKKYLYNNVNTQLRYMHVQLTY